jgi:hypothetical protein
VVPSKADDVSCSPGGVEVTLVGIESAPGWLRKEGVQGFVSVNYGRSRIFQMLAELVLQFSTLCFCKKKVKKKKKKKKGKMAFHQASWPLPVCSTWVSGGAMCYKKLD